MAYWGKRQLGGYPGLHHTAEQICRFIPSCKIYVEPFSGLARTAKYVKAEKKILNDRSFYANAQCRKNFPDAEVTNKDWLVCMTTHDSPETFFLVDPPWYDNIYGLNEKTFIDRPHQEYYSKFLEIAPTLKGNWILCSNVDRKLECPYYRIIVEESNAIFGKKARTLLFSNKPFKSNSLLPIIPA